MDEKTDISGYHRRRNDKTCCVSQLSLRAGQHTLNITRAQVLSPEGHQMRDLGLRSVRSQYTQAGFCSIDKSEATQEPCL